MTLWLFQNSANMPQPVHNEAVELISDNCNTLVLHRAFVVAFFCSCRVLFASSSGSLETRVFCNVRFMAEYPQQNRLHLLPRCLFVSPPPPPCPATDIGSLFALIGTNSSKRELGSQQSGTRAKPEAVLEAPECHRVSNRSPFRPPSSTHQHVKRAVATNQVHKSPPPPMREQHSCQNNTRCCFRNLWTRGIRWFIFLVICEGRVFPVIWGW